MPGNVTIGRTALPNTQFRGNIDQLLQLFVDHLYGTLATGTLTGQLNGTAPTSDIGPWLNDTIWEVWNDDEARYLPLAVTAGRMYLGTLVATTIVSGATVNRQLTTPDKSGTIATLDDVNTPSPAVTVGGSSFFISGALHATHYAVLTAATSIGITGFSDGQQIRVYLEQTAGNSFGVTWTPLINWFDGTPSMSAAAGGHRSVDLYIIERVGDNYFGRYWQVVDITTGSGVGADDSTPPVLASKSFHQDKVTLVYNETLRGGTLSNGSFVVKDNAVTQTISSVIASGNSVVIDLPVSLDKTHTIQVSYTAAGTIIKDVAGNNAPNFALSTVPHGQTSTGGDPGGFGGSNNPPSGLQP